MRSQGMLSGGSFAVMADALSLLRRALLPMLLALPLPGQATKLAVPSLFILPNEGRNPLGPVEALEGGAFVARANGVGAISYNPAGLALSTKSEISAGATSYEWTFYTGQAGEVSNTNSRLSDNGQMFGVVIGEPILTGDRLRFGFAMPVPVSWRTAMQMEGSGQFGVGSGKALYASEGSYTDLAPTFGLGYTLRPGLRIGGSLALSFLTLQQNQLVRVQSGTSSGSALTESMFQANGTTHSLHLAVGTQWDVTPRARFGLAAGTPAWRIGGTSNIILHETVASRSGYQALDLQDAKAGFEINRSPWLSLGFAWRFERGELELNIKAQAPVASYDIFKSKVRGTFVEEGPTGTVISHTALGSSTDQRHTTLNFNVGGGYDLSAQTRLHVGLFSSPSPVVKGTTFEAIDLYGLSTGFTLRWKHLSGSIGLIYEWGGRTLKLPEGTPIASGGIGINSVQLLWGLDYVF